MQSSQLSTVRSPAYPLMPSFGVTSDYVHLRQEGSSETLTSFLEPSRNVDATEPSRPADDSGSVDGIVLDFRPSKSVWSSIRRRSTIEKFLFVLAFVLFIILALLVVVVIKKSSKDYTGVPPSDISGDTSDNVAKGPGGVEYCISSGCVTSASILIDSIDFTQDPCHDFSKFACGKWVDNNPIPDDLTGYSIFTDVRERVKKEMRTILEEADKTSNEIKQTKPVDMTYLIYQKCMDLNTLNDEKTTHLQKALEAVGSWPLLNSSWDQKNVDLTDIIGNLNKGYGLDSFLSLSVYANQRNTSENILTIDQGSLSLGHGSRDYYLNDTQYSEYMAAYRAYLAGHINYLAKDMQLPEKYNETVGKDVDDVIEFEKKLANITVPEEDRRNQSLLYNKWTLKQLYNSMTSINWRAYFKTILPDKVHEKFFTNEDYEIIVAQPEYMAQIDAVLNSTDKRQDFMKVFTGRDQKPLRWKSCVPWAADSSLDLASGALYAQKYFKEKDKSEAFQMVNNLKHAFMEIVHDLDWMDVNTKKLAVEKAEEMIINVGYADFIMNATKLEEYYELLRFDNSSSFFEMNRIESIWQQNKDFMDLLKPFDRHKFEMSPAVVNAFYSPERNSINFPAGILQPPFFKGDFPKAINYGAIGAVIGHEITHGFDDQGSQYDKDGNLNDWWSPASFDKFQTKTKCIVDQYSQYSIPGIKQKVNGKLTQGENIADNGGVKEAYKAYKKYIDTKGTEEPRLPGLNFTNEQVFFLSYAQFWCGHKKRSTLINQILTDPHSPEVFRINGVLSNSNEFAESYKCKPGTFMNPDPKDRKKCSVW